MAIPQHFARDLGGPVELVWSAGLTAAPTLALKGPDATLYVPAGTAATLDFAATKTITATAAVGARTVTVSDATGVANGQPAMIGATAGRPEAVRVASVSGAVVTLARPLFYAHAVAETFLPRRAAYTVTAAQATTLFWRGWIEWTLAGVVAPVDTSVHCTLARVRRAATAENLSAIDPQWRTKVSTDLDIEEMLDAAFDQVIQMLGARFLVLTARGSNAFAQANVWRALELLAVNYGPAFEEQRRFYRGELDRELEELRAVHPFDLNQSGRVAPTEIPIWSLRVDRA